MARRVLLPALSYKVSETESAYFNRSKTEFNKLKDLSFVCSDFDVLFFLVISCSLTIILFIGCAGYHECGLSCVSSYLLFTVIRTNAFIFLSHFFFVISFSFVDVFVYSV